MFLSFQWSLDYCRLHNGYLKSVDPFYHKKRMLQPFLPLGSPDSCNRISRAPSCLQSWFWGFARCSLSNWIGLVHFHQSDKSSHLYLWRWCSVWLWPNWTHLLSFRGFRLSPWACFEVLGFWAASVRRLGWMILENGVLFCFRVWLAGRHHFLASFGAAQGCRQRSSFHCFGAERSRFGFVVAMTSLRFQWT